jgi:hypothetical protein
MEKITNKELKEANVRKNLTTAKNRMRNIGSGKKSKKEDFKMSPSTSDRDLAIALRFKQDLPGSISDTDVLKQYRNKGITSDIDQKIKKQKDARDKKIAKEKFMSNPRVSDRDLSLFNKGISGKKMGGAKMPITQLPTNVPRLKRGASIIGDLDKNGRMSGYEQARQKAIEKNMK